MSRNLLFGFSLVSVLMVSVGGCGGEGAVGGLVPAEGTVKLGDAAVDGASMTFTSDQVNFLGGATTDASGKFVAYTRSEKGLKPGKYKVTVSKFKDPAPAAGETPPATVDPKGAADPSKMSLTDAPKAAAKNELPEKYASPSTTPLEVTIEAAGKKDIVITLEP